MLHDPAGEDSQDQHHASREHDREAGIDPEIFDRGSDELLDPGVGGQFSRRDRDHQEAHQEEQRSAQGLDVNTEARANDDTDYHAVAHPVLLGLEAQDIAQLVNEQHRGKGCAQEAHLLEHGLERHAGLNPLVHRQAAGAVHQDVSGRRNQNERAVNAPVRDADLICSHDQEGSAYKPGGPGCVQDGEAGGLVLGIDCRTHRVDDGLDNSVPQAGADRCVVQRCVSISHVEQHSRARLQ